MQHFLQNRPVRPHDLRHRARCVGQVVRADVEEQHPRRKVKNADSKVRQQFVRHEAADAAVVHHNRQIVFRDELLNRKHFHQRRPGKDDLPLLRGLVQLSMRVILSCLSMLFSSYADYCLRHSAG